MQNEYIYIYIICVYIYIHVIYIYMIIYVCIVCIHQAVPRLLHATVHRDALRRTEEQGHRRGGLGATPPKLSRRKIGKLKLKLKMVTLW